MRTDTFHKLHSLVPQKYDTVHSLHNSNNVKIPKYWTNRFGNSFILAASRTHIMNLNI